MPLSTAWARRGVIAAVGMLTAGALAGCGTGADAQTNQVYDPGAGVNARGGGVDVLNLLVVANPDGSGTLSTALLNNGEQTDQLTEVVATNEGEDLTVDASGLPLDLVAGQLVHLETDGPVYVQDVQPGYFLTVDLTFANAESVQLDVPVVERAGPTDIYSSVPSGSGSAEPTQSQPTVPGDSETTTGPSTGPTTEPTPSS